LPVERVSRHGGVEPPVPDEKLGFVEALWTRPALEQSTMQLRTLASHLCALAAFALAATVSALDANAQQRPIGDWLSAQGRGVGTGLGFPADYLAWTGRIPGKPTSELDKLAVLDYAGIDAAAVEAASGGTVRIDTQISGYVLERRLQNDRTEVRVRLRATNVLSYVLDLASGAVLFGATPEDVASGATPALGDLALEYVYIVDRAPGAAMEDIMEVIFLGRGDLMFVSFAGMADGLIANGGAGQLTVTQSAPVTAAIRNAFRGALADAFPVEMIRLQEF
jgi:hypothetical protein